MQSRRSLTKSTVIETHESIIKGPDEYKPPVGREFGKWNGRNLIVNKSLQAGARSRIPDFTRPVVAAGNNQRSISIEVDGSNRHRVRLDDADGPAIFDIPNPNSLIKRTGDDEIGLRAEIDAENEIGVAA